MEEYYQRLTNFFLFVLFRVLWTVFVFQLTIEGILLLFSVHEFVAHFYDFQTSKNVIKTHQKGKRKKLVNHQLIFPTDLKGFFSISSQEKE